MIQLREISISLCVDRQVCGAGLLVCVCATCIDLAAENMQLPAPPPRNIWCMTHKRGACQRHLLSNGMLLSGDQFHPLPRYQLPRESQALTCSKSRAQIPGQFVFNSGDPKSPLWNIAGFVLYHSERFLLKAAWQPKPILAGPSNSSLSSQTAPSHMSRGCPKSPLSIFDTGVGNLCSKRQAASSFH